MRATRRISELDLHKQVRLAAVGKIETFNVATERLVEGEICHISAAYKYGLANIIFPKDAIRELTGKNVCLSRHFNV